MTTPSPALRQRDEFSLSAYQLSPFPLGFTTRGLDSLPLSGDLCRRVLFTKSADGTVGEMPSGEEAYEIAGGFIIGFKP